ncbi:hypothetical protein PS941_01143 [Pseudomonas fluorescens]|uniref:Uncharacterized protein n=1 Tax=Pseudomonas fluorescens TaxID=294 RepID=A0A5E7SPP4_PSEFL|nr:hypothetical protein PS941_01143 [Pseudomonas fluorescens]
MKKPVSDHGFFIAREKLPLTPALSLGAVRRFGRARVRGFCFYSGAG